MSEYKPNLKVEIGEPKLVKFLFNDPIPVTTKFGQRYRYTLSHESVEHQMLATHTLHTLISQHAPLREKELTISKIKVDDKITAFTINGMTMDDLKKKDSKEFTSVLNGSKPAEAYDDGVAFGTLDDLWRDINKLNKGLKVLMQRAEALENPKSEEAEDLPF